MLAVSSATLAVAAHGAAGGALPDTGLAAIVTVLIAAAGTALADRRRGGPAILAALGVSQLGQHLLLAGLGHRHDLAAAGAGVDGRLMTGAHVAAVLATALLLTRAETALFAVVSAVSLLLPRRLSPAPIGVPLRVSVAPPARVDTLAEVLLRRVCSRRGPPVLG
ncbi:hypothetical protein F0L68_09505 [Solihabitans fulvus]|uniref:Uncharacterized protein n=1 Tax=Solihabitans fulvus TaxID=1892852 RepID=A0A5B2XLJ5_9PSEU|nr:hypothetical protein F0L68_09505 [Solihabitans fulvus]